MMAEKRNIAKRPSRFWLGRAALLACVVLGFGSACINPVRSAQDASSPFGALLNALNLLAQSSTNIYVDGSVGSDTNEGLSTGAAVATITRALALADQQSSSSVRILVRGGLSYPEDIIVNPGPAVASLSIIGGYPDATFTGRQPFANFTSLMGTSLANAVSITGSNSTVILDGLHINGTAIASVSTAVSIATAASVVLKNLYIQGGSGSTESYGIDVLPSSSGNLTVYDSYFEVGGAAPVVVALRVQPDTTAQIVNNLFVMTGGGNLSGIQTLGGTAGKVGILHNTLDLSTGTPLTGIQYVVGPIMTHNAIIVSSGNQGVSGDASGTASFYCHQCGGGNCTVGGVTDGGGQFGAGGVVMLGGTGPTNSFYTITKFQNGGTCANNGSGAASAFATPEGVLFSTMASNAGGSLDSGVLDIGFHYRASPTFTD